jgi:deoxycytidine triphosphate deaminase
MIENCTENDILPCSVNFRLGKVFKMKTSGVVDPPKNMPTPQEAELPYVIEPGEYLLASTIEKMNQTKTKYAAIILPRSRTFRIGLSIQSGIVQPEYKGEIIVGIQNISGHKIRLRRGMDLVHLCFFDVKSDMLPIHKGYQYGRVI